MTSEVANPLGITYGKSICLADIDGDGHNDIIHAANTGGDRAKPGVVWFSLDKTTEIHNISGEQGVKFDLLQAIDLDGDGDLDIIGCEERDNLGVFWYENRRLEQRP